MLKPETKKKIAAYLKIKETDLEAAIKDDKEVDLAIPEDLEVLTKDELEARDTSQKKLGEKDGRELGMKEVKKAAGLADDAPSKDPVKLAQAIVDKAVTDAKIKPDDKVTQLNEQVRLLQGQLQQKDEEVSTAKTAASQAAIERKLLAALPKDRSSALSDDEYLTLIRAGYSIKETDGVLVVEKDGKPLRDPKTTNPLSLQDAIGSIFTDRPGWKGKTEEGTPGGRGGDNGKPPATFTKLSEIKKHYTDQGKSMLGEEFGAEVKKAAEANKDFVMD